MTNEESTAIVKAEARPRALVSSPVPLLDTNKFEHMQRVATAMASASLIPDHLKGSNLGVTTANCFLIVNQALRWNMDPFALAQSCFILHGRIGYEGKLVAAVIEETVGAIDYEWSGEPGTDGYSIRVTAKRPSDGKSVSIEGTVGDWKTYEKSGDVKANWRGRASHNQLAYRGVREWARLYAPSLMYGVYTPDEFDDMDEDARADRARDITPPPPDEDASVAKDDKPKRGPGRPKKADTKADPKGDVIEADTVEAASDVVEDPDAVDDDAKSDTGKSAPDEEPWFSKILAKAGDNHELAAYMHRMKALCAELSAKSRDEFKAAWINREKINATKEEFALVNEIKDHYRNIVDAANAPETEDAPPPDDGGAFDINAFAGHVDAELAKCKTSDDVVRRFSELTDPKVKSGAITDADMDQKLRPVSLKHMERIDG